MVFRSLVQSFLRQTGKFHPETESFFSLSKNFILSDFMEMMLYHNLLVSSRKKEKERRNVGHKVEIAPDQSQKRELDALNIQQLNSHSSMYQSAPSVSPTTYRRQETRVTLIPIIN
jgi:hypothetical protein